MTTVYPSSLQKTCSAMLGFARSGSEVLKNLEKLVYLGEHFLQGKGKSQFLTTLLSQSL